MAKYIKSKNNPLQFEEIPINNIGKKRFWKRQKGLICPSCFKKRGEIPGVPCKYCQGITSKGFNNINELKERCKE